MYTIETANVLIPKDFRHWFDGAKEKELKVFDIEASPDAGGHIGTVKIFAGITFAARKNDENATVKDQWCIVR